jgi:UDP-glucose 4-epimerase
MKVLIPGVSGGIARKVAVALLEAGHEVFGIDKRPWPSAPRGLRHHQVDLRKRAAEDVFRRVRPDAVIHMATVSALSADGEERHRINLGGTQAVFEHARTWGVKQTLFVGRHTFYGAAPDAPLYHTEHEPPRALDAFPELADLVAADLYAATSLWRTPEMTTAVLRFCYTLGAPGSGTLATFLRGRRVPTVLGHDPLFQFMQEDDAVRAVVAALEKKVRGIFNVAGPPPLPLSVVIRGAGRTAVPVPEPVLRRLLGRFGLPKLPPGALSHLKYPIVIDGAAFAGATGFRHVHDELATLAIYRDGGG